MNLVCTPARAFPPTLGYGQGLTFYRWTSDQLSPYGSKPVIITARDATYVLDAILGNETELAILEHTTDTAGVTVILTPVGYTLIPGRGERGRASPTSPDDTAHPHLDSRRPLPTPLT